MDKQQALYNFWHNATGLPCYESGSVPDNAQLPYCTYDTVIDSLDYAVPASASIWNRADSWATLDGIINAVSSYIDRGILVAMDNGRILINKGTPFAMRMDEENDKTIKGYSINIQIEFLTK